MQRLSRSTSFPELKGLNMQTLIISMRRRHVRPFHQIDVGLCIQESAAQVPWKATKHVYLYMHSKHLSISHEICGRTCFQGLHLGTCP